MSFKSLENSSVFVLDSLKSNKTLNSNIQLQLLSQKFNAKTIRQIVFAIAFLTEFLYNGFEFDYNQCRFDTSLMRHHLIKCLEEGLLCPFPKVKKMPKMPVNASKINKIKL